MPFAIQINAKVSTPKYRQIANCIIRNIEKRIVSKEEQLPSINELSSSYDISRDTAEKAYRLLKKEGFIISVRGKGYFAASDSSKSKRKVLLIFNKLSPYKEAIYNSFVQTVGDKAWVDLQIYYENFELFKRIVAEKAGQFTDYVIIPSFKGEEAIKARDIIDQHLSGQKILLLNSALPGLKEQHGMVVQNFEKDIYDALSQAHHRLSQYKSVKLLFPFDCNYPRTIIHGFQKYCIAHNIASKVVFKNYSEESLEKGTAYIVVKDEQLVTLINKVKLNQFHLGKDIGVLAYNDSPLKQIIMDGITVMSTNHNRMGEISANMLLNNDWKYLENEFRLIERGSL